MISCIKKWDNRVLSRIYNLHSPLLGKIMVIISTMGNKGAVWFGLGAPLVINSQSRITGIKFILSILLASFVGEIVIKRLVARMRPSMFIMDEKMLIKKPSTYSFPSGHTSSSVAGATILVIAYGIWAVPVVIFGILMGFSRLYLRVHYPSDVIAGAVLGVACGLVVNMIIV